MSVKHVLVPQTRYEALLSTEEKYFARTTKPEFKGKEVLKDKNLLQEEEEDVSRYLKGEGTPKANINEEELPMIRPPGIPAARRGNLKKWLVWH